jgi:hypothetical protein
VGGEKSGSVFNDTEVLAASFLIHFPHLSPLGCIYFMSQIARLKAEIENHKIDTDNLKAALTQAKNAAQTAANNFAEERDRCPSPPTHSHLCKLTLYLSLPA